MVTIIEVLLLIVLLPIALGIVIAVLGGIREVIPKKVWKALGIGLGLTVVCLIYRVPLEYIPLVWLCCLAILALKAMVAALGDELRTKSPQPKPLVQVVDEREESATLEREQAERRKQAAIHKMVTGYRTYDLSKYWTQEELEGLKSGRQRQKELSQTEQIQKKALEEYWASKRKIEDGSQYTWNTR